MSLWEYNLCGHKKKRKLYMTGENQGYKMVYFIKISEKNPRIHLQE